MYQFIENVKDKIKRMELIIEQNKLTIEDYFNKNVGSYMDFYQKDRYRQKACLKIITPQQSIFALVGERHSYTASSILDTVFDGALQKEDDSHINNNMKLGNIYIIICDTDIKSGKQKFFSKLMSKLMPKLISNLMSKLMLKLMSDVWCNVTIFVPEVFNQYQIDELRKSIEEVKKFKNNFNSQNFTLRHYIKYSDTENETQKKDYEDDEMYLFLDRDKGEANNYIRKIIPNPKEKIIADVLKNSLRNNLKSPIQQGDLLAGREDNTISSSKNYEIEK